MQLCRNGSIHARNQTGAAREVRPTPPPPSQDCAVKMKLVAPPLYVLTTQTLDKQKGIDTLLGGARALAPGVKIVRKGNPTSEEVHALAPGSRGVRHRGFLAKASKARVSDTPFVASMLRGPLWGLLVFARPLDGRVVCFRCGGRPFLPGPSMAGQGGVLPLRRPLLSTRPLDGRVVCLRCGGRSFLPGPSRAGQGGALGSHVVQDACPCCARPAACPGNSLQTPVLHRQQPPAASQRPGSVPSP